METNTQNIIQQYEQIISDDNKLLNAWEYLQKLAIQQNNFLISSLEILINNEYDQKYRLYIGTLIRYLLKDFWNKFDISSQKQVRELLINGLLLNANDLRLIQTIGLMITDLIGVEGLEIWHSYLNDLVNWFSIEDNISTSACLETFCLLMNNSDNKIHIIIPQIMPQLFPMFTRSEITEELREKILIFVYLCIGNFTWADGVNNKIVQDCFGESYDVWMSFFLSALQTSPKSHLNIKRYVLKILTIIYRDLVYYSRKSIPQSINVIWKFLNQFLPLYVWTQVYDIQIDKLDDNLKPIQSKLDSKTRKVLLKLNYVEEFTFELDEDQEFYNDTESMVVQLIELVTSLIAKPFLEPIVRLGIYPLVNVISHYLLLPRYQECLWVRDLNQFVAEDDEEANTRHIRNVCLKLLSELIEKFGDETLQALVLVIEKFLLNLSDEKTFKSLEENLSKMNINQQSQLNLYNLDFDNLMYLVKTSNFDQDQIDLAWKKKEVALLILGSFSEDIIVFQARSDTGFDLLGLLGNLITELEDNQTIALVRGRALWTLSKFSEVISAKKRDLFLPLFKISALSLQNNHQIPVKLSACKTIANIAYKIDKFTNGQLDSKYKSEYLIDNIKNIDECLQLIDKCQEENIHTVIDAILYITKLNSEHSEYVAKISSKKLLKLYIQEFHDLIINKCITELIQQLSKSKQSLIILSNEFLPIVLKQIDKVYNSMINQPDGSISNNQQYGGSALQKGSLSDQVSGFMDIMCILLKNSSQFDAEINFSLMLPNLLKLMSINKDVQLGVHASILLRNFIVYKREQILERNFKVQISEICYILLSPTTNEQISLYAGSLTMIFTQNILNSNYDPNMLKAVATKVYKSKMPSIIQGLVLVYARLINQNTTETLNFLTSFNIDNRIGLKVLIDKWLLHQPLFRGKYTKNATFLALINLFMQKDKRFENLLVIGYNPSHANIGSEVYAPFKIFCTLVRCLENELSSQQREQMTAMEQGYDFARTLNEGNRVEADDGEEDYDSDNLQMRDDDDEDMDSYSNLEQSDKIKVNLEKFRDEEDPQDLEKRFNQLSQRKDKGLADLETGSECYMSEMLDFDFDEDAEADETTDEDLTYLRDACVNINLVDLIKDFFNNLMKNDLEYFNLCVKNLLKDDVLLLQKSLKIKLN